jgi:hypothetical protein
MTDLHRVEPNGGIVQPRHEMYFQKRAYSADYPTNNGDIGWDIRPDPSSRQIDAT